MTHIWSGGMTVRRTLDTAGRSDGSHLEELAARALASPPPYRPVPGIAVPHNSVDGRVILAAAHDLTAPLADSDHRVMALGGEG